jgi:hypothetical protein
MDAEGPNAGVGREPKAPGTLGARIRPAIAKLKHKMARTDTPDLPARHGRRRRQSDVLPPCVAVGLQGSDIDPELASEKRSEATADRKRVRCVRLTRLSGSYKLGIRKTYAIGGDRAQRCGRFASSLLCRRWVLRCPRHGGLGGPAAVIQALSASPLTVISVRSG